MSGNNLSQKNKAASKLSHEIIIFADSLKPSISYIKEGKELVQKVFTLLEQEKIFSIDRKFYGGSVGKETSVIYPDYDCVVFLNRQQPPMESTVKQFRAFLQNNSKVLKIVPESIKNSKITAQVRFTNGAELDLLPACCFSQNEQEQYDNVIKKIAETKNFQDYSSSLAETVINFAKVQKGPTHQLIRLCKFWYKSLTLDAYLYGGSTLIEIVCVAAVYDTESNGNGFYAIHAFRKFFEYISQIDKLKIAFFRETGQSEWKLIPAKDLVQKKYKTYFSAEILKRNNFIIEPANPYNDMAQNLKGPTVDKLKHFAKKMLERLDDLEKPESSNMKTCKTDGNVAIHFEKLFEPFPIRLRSQYSYAAIPVHLLIHYDYQNYETAHCKTEENNKEFFRGNAEAKRATKAIRNNLLFLIRVRAKRDSKGYLQFTDGLAEMAKKDVKDAMEALISQNFGVRKFIKESNANKEHQGYDVTVYVPYRCDGKTYAVRLSLKWEH